MIIELSGTPSSGKSTVSMLLAKASKQNIIVFEESDVPDEIDFDIRKHELRTLWRILDTYLKFVRTLSSNKSSDSEKVFIFNRGLFDRVAWARYMGTKNHLYKTVAEDIEWNLKQYINKVQLVFLFLSPYEKVKQRRLVQGMGVNEVFVNREVVENLNGIYRKVLHDYKDKVSVIRIDDTKEVISIERKVSLVSEHIASAM